MNEFRDMSSVQAAVSISLGDMRELLSDTQLAAVADWLDALGTQQVTHMMTCAPEKLLESRNRIALLSALYGAVTDGSSTGHLF